jgi:hypothetical protein
MVACKRIGAVPLLNRNWKIFMRLHPDMQIWYEHTWKIQRNVKPFPMKPGLEILFFCLTGALRMWSQAVLNCRSQRVRRTSSYLKNVGLIETAGAESWMYYSLLAQKGKYLGYVSGVSSWKLSHIEVRLPIAQDLANSSNTRVVHKFFFANQLCMRIGTESDRMKIKFLLLCTANHAAPR